MARVTPVLPEQADGEVKAMYTKLQNKLGRVPNIFQNMGNSAAVLKGYFGLSEATAACVLPPKVREQIAVAVGELNGCGYCTAAHSAMGKMVGLSEEELLEARRGKASDPKVQAILSFSCAINEKRGWVDESEIEALKSAGVSDQEMTEVILVVCQNIFTNYFNHVTEPQVDFPAVPELS